MATLAGRERSSGARANLLAMTWIRRIPSSLVCVECPIYRVVALFLAVPLLLHFWLGKGGKAKSRGNPTIACNDEGRPQFDGTSLSANFHRLLQARHGAT